jgi:membrane fusion protein, multidrug efflux system
VTQRSDQTRPTRSWLVGLATALCAAAAAAQQSELTVPSSPNLGAPEIRAQLTPLRYTTLSSEMAGRVDKIATRVGGHFRQGDVLVMFDCAVPRAQVARAQAVLTEGERPKSS